jgi:hypothetical protein
VLDLELTDGTVVADTVGETACVFLAGMHRAERNIGDRLLGLSGGSLPWPWIDPDKALPWVAERLKLTFADSQTAAIRQALACASPRGSPAMAISQESLRASDLDDASGTSPLLGAAARAKTLAHFKQLAREIEGVRAGTRVTDPAVCGRPWIRAEET